MCCLVMESSTGCRASFSGVHRLSSPCFPLLLFPLNWESSLNVQSLNWLLVSVSETQTQPAVTSPSVAMDTKMPMNGRGLRGKYLGKNMAGNISNYSSTEATWGKSESWWYLTPGPGHWVPAMSASSCLPEASLINFSFNSVNFLRTFP